MKLNLAKQQNGITSRQQTKVNEIMESDYEIKTLVNSLYKSDRLDLLDNKHFISSLINYAIFKLQIIELKKGASLWIIQAGL